MTLRARLSQSLRRRPTTWAAMAGLAVAVVSLAASGARPMRLSFAPQAAQRLSPTLHPPVPSSIDEAWLVATPRERQRIAQQPAVRALRTASDAARANRYAEAAAALQ